MSDEASVYERLAEQFPIEAHKKVTKGGREQTYIPWTDKVERFNEVLGSNWSYRIVREGMTDTEAWALGEITVVIDGVRSTRQQYGCEPIVKGRNNTPTSDLFKIAGTDALSKAATLFGCGLYLSIREEREEVEALMQEAIRAEAAKRRAESSPPPKAPATASTSAARPTAPATTAAAPAAVTPEVQAAVATTGGPQETPHQEWVALVAEAERVGLSNLRQVKAIDPTALSPSQMRKYVDRLRAQIKEAA